MFAAKFIQKTVENKKTPSFFKDGVFCPALSEYEKAEYNNDKKLISIKKTSKLPVHIIYIGEIADTYHVDDFDIDTFAGGLEEMFYYATQQYKDTRLGYIVNYATPNSDWGGETQDMSEYFEMAKEICNKWRIPYIDLYSGTITLDGVEQSYSYDILDVDSSADVFYNSDAKEVHIGGKGYDIISPFIGYWMRSLDVNNVSDVLYGENVAYKKPVTMSSIEGGYNDDGTLRSGAQYYQIPLVKVKNEVERQTHIAVPKSKTYKKGDNLYLVLDANRNITTTPNQGTVFLSAQALVTTADEIRTARKTLKDFFESFLIEIAFIFFPP